MSAAANMKDAMRVLDPRPLEFEHAGDPQVSPAANKAFYKPLPVEGASESGLKKPGPIERIRQQLLDGGRDTRCFLSGHVGSGKSTELHRLQRDLRAKGSKVYYVDLLEWLNVSEPVTLSSFLVSLLSGWVDQIGTVVAQRTPAERLISFFTKTRLIP